MKKKTLTIALLMAASTLAVHAAKPKKSRLVTPVDSVSYALGMQVGQDLGKNVEALPGGPFQMEIFIEAMSKALTGDTADYQIDKALTATVVQTYIMRAEQERAAKAEQENKIFFENNSKNPNVITTASGLQYEEIQPGTGARPKATDKVKVNYHGTLIDGTVFDSSVERGAPIEFELNKVIPGWTEGVQLMPVGSKYRFYIPPALGYGNRGAGKIKPNSILIFDVELLDIAPPPAGNTGGKIQFPQYQKNN